MYLNSYALYKIRTVATTDGTISEPIHVADPVPLENIVPITLEHDPRSASTMPIETRLELCHDIQTDTSIPLTTYWWFTGTSLRIPFYGTIPVIDILDAISILKEPLYQLTASNDSDARFMERQSQQIQRYRMFASHIQTRNMVHNTFEELIRVVPQATAPAQPQPKVKASQKRSTTGTVPPFVAELILKAAIEKKESCPISYQDFDQLASVTVTKCYHCFDTNALEQWLKTKAECPLCKSPVDRMELTLLEQ